MSRRYIIIFMNSILLVEDTRELALLIQAELVTNGYSVTLAEDGEQALRLFSGTNPNLVILDWMLPKMDGLEVLRRIRQNSAVPVLMLTARREETDRVIGLEVGADDYLTKPFGMRELIARVHAQLRRSELIQSVLILRPRQPGYRLHLRLLAAWIQLRSLPA